jgi:hypothetical protein
LAVEDASVIMPPPPPVVVNDAGSPSASASWSVTCCSSSVHAGEVDHSMPCTPIPPESTSPSTDASDALHGK